MAIRLTTDEPPSASDRVELEVTGTEVWRPCRAKKAAALAAGWSGRRAAAPDAGNVMRELSDALYSVT